MAKSAPPSGLAINNVEYFFPNAASDTNVNVVINCFKKIYPRGPQWP